MRVGAVLLLVLAFSVLLGVAVGILFQGALTVPIDESVVLTKHISNFIKGIHDHKFTLLNSGEGSHLNAKYSPDGSDVRFVLTSEELERKYGAGANLDNDATRDLYHKILEDTEAAQQKWVKIPHRELTPAGLDQDEHEAMMCSIARGRIRQYARSRMMDQKGAFMLNVRDAWTHGLQYLPRAVYNDMKAALSNWLGGRGFGVGMMPTEEELLGIPSATSKKHDDDGGQIQEKFSQTSATLASASSCLSGDEGSQCPGIHLSRFVKGRSAKDLRDACYRTSPTFDKLYGKNKKGASKQGSEEDL
jgi:hypothetical protein